MKNGNLNCENGGWLTFLTRNRLKQWRYSQWQYRI